MLIFVSLCFNIAFYGVVAFLFLQTFRKRAQNVVRKTKSKIQEGIERIKSKSQKSSNSDSSSQSDDEKSKHSVAVKDLEEVMKGISIYSPKNDENNIKNNDSSMSGIPSEADDSPDTDKRTALGLGDSVNQSSIVRNYGIKQFSLMHQNSHIGNSFNNSSLNLLAPGINSAQNSSRRPLNISLNNELRPPGSEISTDRRQGDYLDSPGLPKTLGISYEESPESKPRLNKQISFQDDSLILKIPNSPSETRKLKE